MTRAKIKDWNVAIRTARGSVTKSFSRRILARAGLNLPRLVRTNLKLLRTLSRRPVPLWYWTGMRSAVALLGKRENPLFPSYSELVSLGSEISVPELQAMLRHEQLGAWSVDKDTLEFLWQHLIAKRPRMIAEFGSGVSTVCFALYCATASGSRPGEFKVVSFEQNPDWAAQVRSRLVELGIANYSEILDVPISPEGKYCLADEELSRLFEKQKADLVFVDGPSGPDGCRRWTLPRLGNFAAPDTRWFLDDSFRDGELSCLMEWSNSTGCRVEGIWPIGKGVGTGLLNRSCRQ